MCHTDGMPKLNPNEVQITAAINGPRAVYSVAKHPGLHLAATGNGAASWRIKYRPRGAKHQRWHTLTNDARGAKFREIAEKARAILTTLRLEGTDPRAEIERPKGQTFDDLFNQWIERRAKLHKRTWASDVWLYNKHIKDRIGHESAADLARRDIIGHLTDIASDASPIQSNRCLSIISVVYSWGLSVELVEAHPALRIPKPGVETVRDRVLSHAEIAALWNALGDIISERREGMTPRLARLTQVLMLTGQRKSEVANLPVSEIVGDAWIIPAARMKAKRQHLVPLAPLAQATIRVAIADSTPSPLVFPGRDGGLLEPMSSGHAFTRLTTALGIKNIRLHDLRRTMASEMGRLGVPEQIISRVLAHTQSGITARVYNLHSYANDKRDALLRWEAELMRIAAPR